MIHSTTYEKCWRAVSLVKDTHPYSTFSSPLLDNSCLQVWCLAPFLFHPDVSLVGWWERMRGEVGNFHLFWRMETSRFFLLGNWHIFAWGWWQLINFAGIHFPPPLCSLITKRRQTANICPSVSSGTWPKHRSMKKCNTYAVCAHHCCCCCS